MMNSTVLLIDIIGITLAVLGVMIYRLVSKGKDVRLPRCATCSIMYRETIEKPSRDCVHLGADSNQDAEG